MIAPSLNIDQSAAVRWIVRLMLLGLLAGFGAVAHSAEKISPILVQSVLDILTDAEADPEEALSDLGRLSERTRSDVERAFVLSERAALLIQQDRMDMARAEMALLLAEQPPEFAPRLRNLYATTLLAEENYTEALEQLEMWSAYSEVVHPHGLFLMGYACVRLERYEEAVVALERAVRSDYPTRDPWVELLAFAYTQVGRPEEAVALLESLIAEHPDRQRWWKQLGGILMLLDRLPEGTAGMAVAQTLEPLSYSDQRRLARLFAHLGMPSEGAELLGVAIEAREEAADFEELMLLGELWMLARETDRAIETFSEAQAVADQGEAALMIAQLHAQREEYELARDALEVAVAAYGESTPSRAYYLLAVIQINLGNLSAASEAVSRLEMDEDYQERAANLATYIDGVLGQS
ncbi:MAG: tetratricopeptide repeat protein [Gammaproteobacteria bacterium]|nr:MAG: tetratricopeptide repeat protein [Gammaproteobacteria bacterium]